MVDRREFTLSCRAFVLARVIGPLGRLGGLEAVVSEGHPVSSPPLGMIRPRLFIGYRTMVGFEVEDIEGVAHHVLGGRDVDDVCVIVDALDDLEGTITTRPQLGVSSF